MKDEFDKKWIEMGVIRFFISFWVLLVVIVFKKDGGICFCIDYRKFNKVVKFDVYLMLWSY